MKVFITGATSGIGLNLAKKYLERGDIVGLAGRDTTKIPEEIISHVNAKIYSCDVNDQQRVFEVIADFADFMAPEHQGLDIVYANAGIAIAYKSDIANFSLGRQIFETNIMGVVNTFDAALKVMMSQKRGHLVATSSVAGFVGLPGAGFYSASKSAVNTLCESFSIDLKKYGIDVTSICPGFIDTPLTEKNNHPMPFIMSADRASDKIIRAVDKKKPLYLFPLPMKIAIIIANKMPRALYRFLAKINVFGK